MEDLYGKSHHKLLIRYTKRNSKLFSVHMVSTNSHCYSFLHEKSIFWGENHVYTVGRFLLKLVQYVALVKFSKVFKNVLYFIVINPLKSEESLSLFLSICSKLNYLQAVCDLFYFIPNYLTYFKNVCSKQHWSVKPRW